MEVSSHSDRLSTLTIAGSFAALFLVYQLSRAIYTVFFHPLKSIPGPWYASLTRIPYVRHLLGGSILPYLSDLHNKYGDIVRYSPNEISVISGEQAWQDIYGFRIGKSKGTSTFLKDPTWYAPPLDGIPGMFTSGDGDHGRQRKIISHAFSDKALRDQEGLLQGYANLLVRRLKETVSKSSEPVDLCVWYNWTAFDVIADLVFGEPFGCLANLDTHEYVNLILGSIYAFPLYYVISYFPFVKKLGSLVVNQDRLAQRTKFQHFVRTTTKQRIERQTDRADFTTPILPHLEGTSGVGKKGVTAQEIATNNTTLMAAGTETTATTLSAVTFNLLKHPEVLHKVQAEVRSRFKTDADITVEACNGLEYMLACLNEALRIHPPVPAGFLRKVPKEGGVVSGHFIPGGCNASISMTQYVSYHSERNFRDPGSYVPERWLRDERYKDDNRATFSPFSFGPRNCLGKNLAYAEMRLFLAKLLFHFDMELDASSKNWSTDPKVLALYVKPPLMVKLTPV